MHLSVIAPLLSGFQSLMTCCYMQRNLITLSVRQPLGLFNISRLHGISELYFLVIASMYNTWRKQSVSIHIHLNGVTLPSSTQPRILNLRLETLTF